MSKSRTKILLLAVLTLLGFFGVKSYQIIKQKESFGKQLPNFSESLTVDSTHFSIQKIPQNTPVIVLYLDPDCGICTKQVEELIKSKSQLENAQVFLVSVESVTQHRAFAQKYGLSQIPNFYLLSLPKAELYKTFGSAASPHLFVYNTQHQLVKDFKFPFSVADALPLIRQH